MMSTITDRSPLPVPELTHDALPPATHSAPEVAAPVVISLQAVSFYYGAFRAVKDITFDVPTHQITSIIGPSGSGKSTLLRSINRMNDLIAGTRVEGKIMYHDEDLYASYVDPVEVRRRIGMVFQKPNPFPKSIYDNVAFGPRLNGFKGDLDGLVEQSLRRAAIWDEVKDKLKQSGLSLSGGQQQRLCIARAIATDPEVILMDEPASALDPIATSAIEDLMQELKAKYTIVIVTHNMQQATRVSDRTAFFSVLVNDESDTRTGVLVEYGPTGQIFQSPRDPRTQAYVTGRIG